MKKTLYIIICISVIAGCRHKEPSVGKIEITPGEITCDNCGGEFPVSIKHSELWIFLDTLDWMDVVRIDEGSAMVRIQNNESYERSGRILFFAQKSYAELSVTQAGSDEFSISCNSKKISHLEEIFEISISTFRPWVVKTDQNWISTDISSSDGPATVMATVAANPDRKERSGNIIFIQESDTLKVKIDQAALPFIELAKEKIRVDGDGGTFDIPFLSNYNAEVTCEENWIRIIRLSSGNVVSFEVLRNTAEARQGSIRICSEVDKNIYKIITIEQGEKVPHPALRFEEGTEMSIIDEAVITLHPIFEDMTDNQLIWSSSNTDIAEVDADGNVSIHQTGNCTITARSRFHNVETSIVLNIRLKAQQFMVMFGNQDMMEVPVSSRFVGEKIPVEIIVTPSYAYSEDFTFFSSNSEVAEFENNTLHCLKTGKTEIHIESIFNNLSYTFTVFVIDLQK